MFLSFKRFFKTSYWTNTRPWNGRILFCCFKICSFSQYYFKRFTNVLDRNCIWNQRRTAKENLNFLFCEQKLCHNMFFLCHATSVYLFGLSNISFQFIWTIKIINSAIISIDILSSKWGFFNRCQQFIQQKHYYNAIASICCGCKHIFVLLFI